MDRFTRDVVSGTPASSPPLSEALAWQFDGDRALGVEPAATWGWGNGPDVADLQVRDGSLTGTVIGDFPILRVERTGDVDERDTLHAIEIRARVSAGENLWLDVNADDETSFEEIAENGRAGTWRMATPLQAGDEMQTYTVTTNQTVSMAAARFVLVRPTDATEADFEIDYIRVVSRREHLASIDSGIGWQGLAEIYHETLVARSPETLSFEVEMPARPWLDLALGSPEEQPVTFHVQVSSGATEPMMSHTITSPHRWERRRIPLDAFAGQTVTVSLSLAAQDDGTIGFWGTPVIRSGAGETGSRAEGALGAAPRGVIYIQADTLRSDHLDMYGYDRETAPTLAGLADEGTRFSAANAQATWTKVSTSSFMTSLYPLSTGVHEFADRLPASAVTLAERFRDAGYATLGLSSVLFTGQFTNLHQGYEELHEFGSVEPSPKTSRVYVDRVAEWLEVHHDVPFFIYLHVFDPHDPYEPFRPYDTLWADPTHKEEHEANLERVREVIDDPLRRSFGMPTRAELEEVNVASDEYIDYDQGWYDGSIRGMDVEMGRLVERLRGLGLDDDTLVVFASDHGEEFFDHGQMFHGQSVYGELARVPLFMRWPARIPDGIVVDDTVQLIDIMPTLLELAGLPAVDGAQGQSLVPLLADSVGEWVPRPAFIQKAITTDPRGPSPRDTESYAVIAGQWKLVHNRVRHDESPEFELYDVGADPLDLVDLSAEHPDVVERLARDIDRWHRVAEAARLPADADSTEGMSPEQLERLRGLGYIR